MIEPSHYYRPPDRLLANYREKCLETSCDVTVYHTPLVLHFVCPEFHSLFTELPVTAFPVVICWHCYHIDSFFLVTGYALVTFLLL